jgi:alkanesulfonate monooxygenase SsuD/methylene tetrahydromethanopterin reductase-like flavin-dependent oxidoreductase (luciferase family)
MLFGIHVFPTEHSIQPNELARAAEERGLESIWFSEHTHIPVNFLRTTERGQALPEYYWQTYDPFVALTQAAASTESIKLGSGVILVIEHDPIILANAVASLDLISQGRFIFGIGAGWLEAEMANHGVVYRTRFQLLKEQIRAMKEIWTTEPHPPLIMGGAGQKSLECVVDVCDGWAPWLLEWSKTKEIIAKLRQKAVTIGRNPDSLEMSVFEESIPNPRMLAEMEEAGVKRVIITIFGQSRDESLPILDKLAEANV